MSVDRILQLKLITDVGDINRKMGQAEGSVGRVRGAFAGLKAFAGPVVLTAALEGLSKLGDAVGTGMSDMRAYDDAVFGLGQRLRDSFSAAEVDRIASDLTSIGTALGFGDDAALVRGLELATGRLGDLESGQRAVAAAMDVARAKGIPFATALDLVLKGADGSSRAMKTLGIEGETAEDRWADIEGTFGGAAEAFAGTAEGANQIRDARIGDIFEAIGGAINDLIDEALPVFDELWAAWSPVVEELAAGIGPAFERVGEVVGKFVELIDALAPHLQTAWQLMAPIVAAIGRAVGRTFDGIMEVIDALIDVLQGGDIGAAFRKAFGGIVNIVKAPLNLMLGAVENALNWLGGLFMDALEAIRSNLNNVAFVGDHVPDSPIVWHGVTVPRLAAGGIVSSPTLALIGEAGREAVVPLDQAGGLMGGITVNIYGIVTDPAATGRQVVEAIQAYERRAGATWRAAA